MLDDAMASSISNFLQEPLPSPRKSSGLMNIKRQATKKKSRPKKSARFNTNELMVNARMEEARQKALRQAKEQEVQEQRRRAEEDREQLRVRIKAEGVMRDASLKEKAQTKMAQINSTKIQAHVRRRQAENGLKDARKRACMLQSVARAKKVRPMRSYREQAVRIQSATRRKQAKAYAQERRVQHKSAVMMQAVTRGRLTQLNQEQEAASATRIQAHIRRKGVERENAALQHRATVIQAARRRQVNRRAYWQERSIRLHTRQWRDRRRTEAATGIQAHIRRRQTNQQTAQRQRQATIIQSKVRAKVQQGQYKREQQGACVLQKQTRGFLEHRQRQRGATLIQAKVRGKQVQRAQNERHNNATTIQAVARQRRQAKEDKKKREGAQQIQRKVRTVQVWKREKAATMIQTRARVRLAEREANKALQWQELYRPKGNVTKAEEERDQEVDAGDGEAGAADFQLPTRGYASRVGDEAIMGGMKLQMYYKQQIIRRQKDAKDLEFDLLLGFVAEYDYRLSNVQWVEVATAMNAALAFSSSSTNSAQDMTASTTAVRASTAAVLRRKLQRRSGRTRGDKVQSYSAKLCREFFVEERRKRARKEKEKQLKKEREQRNGVQKKVQRGWEASKKSAGARAASASGGTPTVSAKVSAQVGRAKLGVRARSAKGSARAGSVKGRARSGKMDAKLRPLPPISTSETAAVGRMAVKKRAIEKGSPTLKTTDPPPRVATAYSECFSAYQASSGDEAALAHHASSYDATELRNQHAEQNSRNSILNAAEKNALPFAESYQSEVEEQGSEEQQEVSEEGKVQVQKETDEVQKEMDEAQKETLGANPSGAMELRNQHAERNSRKSIMNAARNGLSGSNTRQEQHTYTLPSRPVTADSRRRSPVRPRTAQQPAIDPSKLTLSAFSSSQRRGGSNKRPASRVSNAKKKAHRQAQWHDEEGRGSYNLRQTRATAKKMGLETIRNSTNMAAYRLETIRNSTNMAAYRLETIRNSTNMAAYRLDTYEQRPPRRPATIGQRRKRRQWRQMHSRTGGADNTAGQAECQLSSVLKLDAAALAALRRELLHTDEQDADDACATQPPPPLTPGEALRLIREKAKGVGEASVGESGYMSSPISITPVGMVSEGSKPEMQLPALKHGQPVPLNCTS
jgi:hypothetical protein